MSIKRSDCAVSAVVIHEFESLKGVRRPVGDAKDEKLSTPHAILLSGNGDSLLYSEHVSHTIKRIAGRYYLPSLL